MAVEAPAVRLRPGVVVQSGAALAVNVDGALPAVQWPAGYVPAVGDPVKVLVVDGGAVVLGPVIAGQRPLTGTVLGAPASGTVPVSTAAGTLQCRYLDPAPALGALVRLDWQATTPWIWPTAAAAIPEDAPAPEVAPAPAKPPTVTAGALTVPALDSATWNHAYNAWSSTHKNNVVQGSWGGQSYSGAWFYGSAPGQLAGRVITGFRVRLGARLRIGSYNASLSLNLWWHTAKTRPGGDVARQSTPQTVVLPVSAGARWVGLPAAWGQAIVDGGGGLGISGGSYGGVAGIRDDPASGQLAFDWTRS